MHAAVILSDFATLQQGNQYPALRKIAGAAGTLFLTALRWVNLKGSEDPPKCNSMLILSEAVRIETLRCFPPRENVRSGRFGSSARTATVQECRFMNFYACSFAFACMAPLYVLKAPLRLSNPWAAYPGGPSRDISTATTLPTSRVRNPTVRSAHS